MKRSRFTEEQIMGMPGAGRRYLDLRLRVSRELDNVIAARGRPAMCVSDNGTELTSMAILAWSQQMRITDSKSFRPDVAAKCRAGPFSRSSADIRRRLRLT